jgi:N5-(cytidine 5'-diphosphoramidyl)-L-glutamine hydrolase
MKKIAISQNVFTLKDRNETRDSLDQNWWKFLSSVSLLPVVIPNRLPLAKELLAETDIDGVILTGGNDILSVGGTNPERDEVEKFLLDYCLKKSLPLIGVCRGMQLIVDSFGKCPEKIENHVAKRHLVKFLESGTSREVNSFHNFGFVSVPEQFDVLAKAPDQSIEAIRLMGKNIFGIMWHPERESPFSGEDQALFQRVFHGS